MHEIITEIEIEATAEKLWNILLDFPSYPEWNPFVRSIAGVAKIGHRLAIFVQPDGPWSREIRPRRKVFGRAGPVR
jgi:hypothetical protein